jgi:hypothetical protein
MALPEDQLPVEDENDFFDYASDALMGIPRGVEGAIQGAYNLADYLAFDVLPDYDTRFLGTSKTMAGGAVEGITQFATGFVPLFGLAGRAGALAKAGTATKAVVAGAATDFTFFNGQEARLSNLIQQVPELQNPVTEFLAYDGDEGELEGRMKNVLEGLGLEAVAGVFIKSLKAMKKARKVKEETGDAQKVADSITEDLAGEIVVPTREVVEEPVGVDLEGQLESWILDRQQFYKDEYLKQGGKKTAGWEDQALQKVSVELQEGKLPDGFSQEDIEMILPLTKDRETGDIIGPSAPSKAGAKYPRTGTLLDFLEGRQAKKIEEVIDDEVDAFEWARKQEAEAPKPIPEYKPNKQEEFLNAIPEKFRGYADELIKGGTPRLPQFALETGEDVITLKDVLESYYKENPDKITVEGAVTEVGEEIERQLMLQQGKDAATKVAEARVVQQSLRDQGSAVIDNLNQSLKKFDETDGGGVSIAEIKNNFQQLLSIADVYIKLGKEGGAFLGARREKYRTRKIGLSESDFFIDGIRKEFVNASGMDPKKMVSIIKENIDPLDPDATFDKLFKISKKAQGKHFLDMPTEYWMNAILSGPKTQVVNAMGNSLTQIWSSIEAVMGGIASGNMDVVRAVMASWADKEMFKEAGKFAKKAFKQSDNILDPEARAFSDRPSVAITGQRISEALPGQGLSVKQEQGLDWFANNVLRIPSRLLMTTDEFFKQLAYRRAARLKAAMSGIQQGVNDPKRLAEYINKTLEGVITEGGRMASKEGLAREANEIAASKGIKDSIEKNKFIIDYVEKNFNEDKSALIQYAQDEARYLTFTKELEEGIGKTFQDFTNRHPGFRFILPFVRTPTNILTFAIERTPLVANPLMKQEFEILRKEISSADPIVKAQARGKVVSAGLLTLGLVEAVTDADGSITGGGPKNEREKKALQAAGWQPYSIKIGDTYYSYQRLDPLATPLGIIADLVETGRDISALESKDSEKLIEHAYQSFIISLTRNITNKSYLTGVQNFVDALSDPDRFASKFNKNFASSFVPNILSQMADSDEQVMKETRGVMDAVKRKLGARGGLDSKRNALGEEIMTETLLASPIQALNPIAISTKKDDPVLQAMAELKHGFRNPIPNLGGDIDLLDYETESGQSAYDRWLQLSSEIRVKGDTLRQRLNRLVKSREFKDMSPLSEPGLPSPRIQMISSILDEYRKAARAEMLKEFPELDRKYSSLTLARTRLKTGVSREDVLALLTQ